VYELEIITDGFVELFKDPRSFFRDISRKEILLLIPIVVLIITGLIMTVITLHHLPSQIEQWKKTGDDLHYNINTLVKAVKIKAFLFPIWLLLFWALVTIAMSYISSSLGGWGEFQGFFNCTSFLVYPFAVLQIIRFILNLIPALLPIYYILLAAYVIWAAYSLIELERGAGELDLMHSIVAVLVPGFFYVLLWLSYEPVINMIVVNVQK
jgi:hypothetical protein